MRLFRGVEHVFAAAHGKAGGLSRARVVDDDSGGFVEFGAMVEGVGAGANQSLLFAGEKNEADGAPRLHARSFDGPQGIDDQRGVAAVIERARAEFPGIEVRAKNDELVRLLAAPDFCDHIGRP